jgi:uncharacterized protein
MKLIRRRLPEIAFATLFGVGLMLGGNAALAGLPKLVDAVVPGMAARANVAETHEVARLVVRPDPLKSGFAESRFTPQVLYPVARASMPAWLTEAIREANAGGPPPAPPRQRPVIAICIDDLGEDIAGTAKAMALPGEVALSFLPYADATPTLAQASGRSGHLVLAHVPMQALGGQNPGPMALKSGMAADEIAHRLGWSLARVPGLVGINNHEGSRFTEDGASLQPVMDILRTRHLFFLDSRTGPDSHAEAEAHAAGVMTAGRDVFLDDDQSPAAVEAELEKLAAMAKRSGVAIAIGHPHDATLTLLAAWLAQDHGVTLVPLDEAMRLKNRNPATVAAR